MPSSPERYVALQQQSTGAVQVIAGTLWTTDAQQLEEYVRGQLRLTATESLLEQGVSIVPRIVAWDLFPLAMQQWTELMVDM